MKINGTIEGIPPEMQAAFVGDFIALTEKYNGEAMVSFVSPGGEVISDSETEDSMPYSKQQKAELERILADRRRDMVDREWLEYYDAIGFPAGSHHTREQKIQAAVQFDAAESGVLPDWFYGWTDGQ